MTDAIAMLQDLVDLSLNLQACANVQVVGKNMGGHRTQALCETPHMDIVHAKHAVNLGNFLDHRLDVYIARGGLEQNVDRISQNAPGIVNDEESDQHAHERIEPIGISEINNHTCDDRADCREHIPHQVHKRRAEVEIMFTAAVYKQGSNEINNNRDESHANKNT